MYKKKKSKIEENKKLIVIGTAIIAFLIFLSIIFALINVNNKNMMSTIKIQNIQISNLSKEEAIQKIKNWKEEKISNSIVLKYNELEENINLEQLNVIYNTEKAIDEAYRTGRKGNIIQNNYDILFTFIFSKNIKLEYSYNEENLNKIIEELESKIPGAVVQSDYYIEDTNLIIKKGQKRSTNKQRRAKKFNNKKYRK